MIHVSESHKLIYVSYIESTDTCISPYIHLLGKNQFGEKTRNTDCTKSFKRASTDVDCALLHTKKYNFRIFITYINDNYFFDQLGI